MKKNTFIFTVGISIVLTTRVYSSTVLAETFTTESDTYTVQNEDMTKFENMDKEKEKEKKESEDLSDN